MAQVTVELKYLDGTRNHRIGIYSYSKWTEDI
jgi:hypothetical protein